MTKSYFEYYYHKGHSHPGNKTLIVSFPGSAGNRALESAPVQTKPFLLKSLGASHADVLLIRAAYEGSEWDANVTSNFGLLPGFLHDVRKKNKIDRMVLFGYSLGCGPCLGLARKEVADEVVILAPGRNILSTLCAIDDPRWEHAFNQLCDREPLPPMENFPESIVMKVLYGSRYKKDGLRDEEISTLLMHYAPHATVETVLDADHQVLLCWQEEGVLREKVHGMLGIQTTSLDFIPDYHAVQWSRLAASVQPFRPSLKTPQLQPGM